MSQSSRYSVQIDFQTTAEKAHDDFAKLVLGFLSAALKAKNFQVKKVFEKEPIRIVVSSRNFQEGEIIAVVSHHNDDSCFVYTKCYYNKDRETATKISSEKIPGDNSASSIFKFVYAKMNSIKDEKPHHIHLNPVKGQTGPTKGKTRPEQKYKVADDILPKIQDKLGM